ncbi:efflux RND transporter periplasmic adaptor subunit [Pseudohongiella sp. SYSU M77423]|uniref:efflux RND transporter periplasmic adaptor subunit n=1 Tax=Pseudohongiella sp. SYSU M77423 TaxID=3042312 RepID=UPI00248110AB|nr:efflux RND transporter periplasmic adaptor subunit [Pseudohongiella sp. SYSU M77423]MDH7943637.1 efflux RND transporter periplasmic adaptor subunit [Pseudohongiella sp. SYSU M77423]
MKKQYLVAVGLVALIVIWMVMPRGERADDDRYAISEDQPQINVVPESASMSGSGEDFTVRARRVNADMFTQSVSVRGRTQADRLVDVRAETAGRIIGTPVAEGERVRQGDTLCELAMDTRQSDLQEALSRVEQTRREYEGAQDLQRRDLESSVSVSQRKAAYDSAVAAAARAELAVERTKIKAPFDGIMESRLVEVGGYMDMGGVCATLMDDRPMLLVAQVPELEVGKLELGSQVTGRLVTGERVQGTLTYIARAADNMSRSYRIEVALNLQDDQLIRQGVSTDIQIAANQSRAHLVPPSSLTMDDQGMVGVKTLNSDNVVEFHHVEIVGESTDMTNPGFWVAGLPDQVTLITLGQELVFAGQQVNANFDWAQQ